MLRDTSTINTYQTFDIKSGGVSNWILNELIKAANTGIKIPISLSLIKEVDEILENSREFWGILVVVHCRTGTVGDWYTMDGHHIAY